MNRSTGDSHAGNLYGSSRCFLEDEDGDGDEVGDEDEEDSDDIVIVDI